MKRAAFLVMLVFAIFVAAPSTATAAPSRARGISTWSSISTRRVSRPIQPPTFSWNFNVREY